MFRLLEVIKFRFLKLDVLRFDVWLVSTHFGSNFYGCLIFKSYSVVKSNNSGTILIFVCIYLYPSSSLKSSKYACFNACYAENRLLGEYCIRLWTKSMSRGSLVLRTWIRELLRFSIKFFWQWGTLSITWGHINDSFRWLTLFWAFPWFLWFQWADQFGNLPKRAVLHWSFLPRCILWTRYQSGRCN